LELASAKSSGKRETKLPLAFLPDQLQDVPVMPDDARWQHLARTLLYLRGAT
jgi:hypothetical protein